MCGSGRSDQADAVIARLAGSQHGVVSRTQLLAAGVTGRQIDWRLRHRRLHRLFAGVYAVGHGALPYEGRWMAAVLVAGADAVLSHWSAATLLGMRSGRGPRSHVTCPRRRRRLQTVTFHRAMLPPDEVTVANGIPTTTPSRTLLDLAPLLPSPTLARMLAAAQAHEGAPLEELLDRYPRKPGVPKLRAILAEPIAMTRSDLEAHVLAAIGRAGLPTPDVNSVIEGYEVDLAWPDRRVIAEIDSYVTHRDRHAFETDRERDRKLAIAGWTVVRLTGDAGVADLSRLLAASAARSRAAA